MTDGSNDVKHHPTVAAGTTTLVVTLVVVTLCLIYVGVTGHVWEDYFITFRHSKNLAEGHGLVFQPGERVHGFTSPMGVLLPALFHRIAGNPDSYLPALILFRVVSMLALAIGVIVGVRGLGVETRSIMFTIGVAMVLVADPKVVGFAMNGQEAGLMFALVAWCVDIGRDASERAWIRLGWAWALLQWTRPDGFIFGGVIAVCELVAPGSAPRSVLMRRYLKAAGLALVLYAPWLIFCTVYFGSPIPHTITAKSGVMPRHDTIVQWIQLVVDRLAWFLQPTNAFFGDWPTWVTRLARTLGLAGLLVWMVAPLGNAGLAARRASLAYTGIMMYFLVIPLAAWYLPPAIFLLLGCLLALATAAPVRTGWLLIGCFAVITMIEENRLRIGHSLQNTLLISGGIWLAITWFLPRRAAVGTIMLALLAFLIPMNAAATWQISVQQRVIETNHRRVIGEWLRDHVAPHENVYLECLGYMGYFSGCRMLDFPGLATPRVVAAHRARTWNPRDVPVDRMIKIIPDLDPDWLVMRPHEWSRASAVPGLENRYTLVKEFNVLPELEARYSKLPGLGYLRADAHFIVLHRK